MHTPSNTKGRLVKSRYAPLIVALALAATACGTQPTAEQSALISTTAAADTFEFKGTIALHIDGLGKVYDVGSGCEGGARNPDLGVGGTVKVFNVKGETLGTGTLGVGEVTDNTCMIPFTVADIPTGEGTYLYEVGNRGTESLAEAEARRGFVFTWTEGK